MNPIRISSLYYGAFALQWVSLLAAYSIEGTAWLLVGGGVGGILLALSLRTGSRGRYSDSNTTLTYTGMVAAILIAMLIWPSMGADIGALHLLIGLIAASNLSMTTRRNLYFTYVGTLFIVLYAASRSSDGIFALWIVLYVLAGVFTLMSAHLDARLDASMGYDEDRTGRISWPAVILVTLTLLLETGLVFLFFPRLPPMQASAFPSGGGTNYDADANFKDHNALGDHKSPTGPDDRMGDGRSPAPQERETRSGTDNRPDGGTPTASKSGGDSSGGGNPLDISTQARLDTRLMFYLQADRPLYLRIHAYNEFDGTLWRHTDPEQVDIYRPQRNFVLDRTPPADGHAIFQRYVINEYNEATLPLAEHLVSIHFPGDTLRINREGEISALRPLEKGTSYSVESVHRNVASHSAEGNGEREIDTARYLQVPPQVTARTAKLAKQIAGDATDDLERAIRIENYLKTNYPYSFSSLGIHPEQGLVEWFLFDNQKGHCELYASSMAMMLRQLGIPSRFVTGYVATFPNPITGYYEIRNPGHAWIEAWIPPHGWVSFEPTAGWDNMEFEFSPFLILSLIDYLKDQIRTDEQNSPRLQEDTPGLMQAILAFLQGLWAVALILFQGVLTVANLLYAWLLSWGIAVVAAFLVAVIGWLSLGNWIAGRLALLRLRLSSGQSNRERVLLSWFELESVFARIGHPRPQGTTPDEYQLSISTAIPEAGESVSWLCEIFQNSRYGGYKATDKDVYSAIVIVTGLIRAVMRPALPFRKPLL